MTKIDTSPWFDFAFLCNRLVTEWLQAFPVSFVVLVQTAPTNLNTSKGDFAISFAPTNLNTSKGDVAMSHKNNHLGKFMACIHGVEWNYQMERPPTLSQHGYSKIGLTAWTCGILNNPSPLLKFELLCNSTEYKTNQKPIRESEPGNLLINNIFKLNEQSDLMADLLTQTFLFALHERCQYGQRQPDTITKMMME